MACCSSDLQKKKRTVQKHFIQNSYWRAGRGNEGAGDGVLADGVKCFVCTFETATQKFIDDVQKEL